MNYKLGSLFDGSGGFPLSGALCGVEPVWAAEVEPYPIAVTRSRFPNMKHLGDISKVNGGEIEPVDIITFGSPCQDLSVAGKRAGLKHEANGDEETTRSGLFMEAVRIIKEMRRATNGKYPSMAIWENVPGAFSSNNGEDFRIVCEELIKIVEPSASMPSVPQNGWNYADSYVGDGWSLAYRVFDAQYWGVPQRRRRIYLVTDFRGERAREVLFEREGLRGYFATGRTPWQTTAADAERSTGADDREGEWLGGRQLDAIGLDLYNGAETGDKAATLTTQGGGTASGPSVAVPYTLKIRSGCEGGGKGALIQEDKSATLATNNDQYLFQPITDTHILDDQGGSVMNVRTDGKAPTLRAQMGGHPPVVMVPPAYSVENHPADSRVDIDDSGKVQTLTSRMGTGGGNVPMVMEPFVKSARGKFKGDAETWKDGKVANTLNTFDQGETRANELVVEGQPVYCLQGNGIDRADTAGCNGRGVKEDICYTLNTIDRPAVAYGLDRAAFNQGQNAQFDFSVSEEQQPTLTARGPGAVCCTTGSYTQITEEVSPTLMARDWKDPTCVCSNYIVRRLTPTECARLQGFADWWGVIEPKDSLTDEEYRFWCEVYLTKQIIDGKVEYDENGKPHYVESKKPFTHKKVKQMLTWYNKLWTDSAEYKMWGNGIALPTALYCVQGVVEALMAPIEAEFEECDNDDWMN